MKLEGAIMNLKKKNKELKHLYNITNIEFDKTDRKNKERRDKLFDDIMKMYDEMQENIKKIEFYENLLKSERKLK